MILHTLAQREPVGLARCWLEYIEPTIQHQLPAGIGGDIARMETAGAIKGPSEIRPGSGAGLRDTIKAFTLLLNIPVIRGCDQMHL